MEYNTEEYEYDMVCDDNGAISLGGFTELDKKLIKEKYEQKNKEKENERN